jgi:transposase
LLGRAEPSLMRGGRTMSEYSEAFAAFDVTQMKHAVAVAEGGRTGEVRFLGEIENRSGAIERTVRKLAGRYDRLHVCFDAGSTGCGLYRGPRLHGGRAGFDPEAGGELPSLDHMCA